MNRGLRGWGPGTVKRCNWFFATLALLALATPARSQTDTPVGLRMIVLRTEADAMSVRARLEAGENFEDLARKQSVDPSAREGGYLGLLTISQLRLEFQSALDGLKPGQVSPISRLAGGYALLQLLTDDETHGIELKAWIDGGKDPGSPIIDRLWTMTLASNDVRMIQRVVDAGVNVNTSFGDGSTVLMGAAQAGQIDIVRALLAAGASVNAQAGDGTTALLVAAQAGRADVAGVLLNAGAQVNARTQNGVTPLIDASFGGHSSTVRVLLESKADPNLALKDGATALMAASGKGHNDIVRALVAAGAQVNAGLAGGGTALMEAAYGGHPETVRILLAAGADPKAADPNGLTALMGAALKGDAETIRALLDAGAPAGPRDAKGWTALTYARASANPAAVRLVLDRSTDLSPQERSLALGGVYINEYYSSNDAKLINLAAAEFQKVLSAQPQNLAALEWMGAVEFLRWTNPPTLEQFKKANSLLKKSVDLDPKDPDRHCWIAATAAIFATTAKGASASETAAIVDQGIQHARRAIELDPQFADAMDHLSLLYRRKAEQMKTTAERDELRKMADATQSDAGRIRERLGNKPSRFNDQFSRPALPPPL
jgi:ankyrin repeat protein